MSSLCLNNKIMFDRDILVSKLQSIVGYSQSFIPPVTSIFIAGDQFSKVDLKHPLVTHKNIEASWGGSDTTDTYEDYLNKVRREYILTAIQDLFDYKRLNYGTKQLISDVKGIFGERLVYNTAGFLGNSFVGHRIRAKNRGSRAIKINKVGLNLLNPQEVTLYIFKGENFTRENAYATLDINYQGNGSYQWSDASESLTFIEENESFYIGFFEEDLATVGNTYMTREFNFATGPCGSCNTYDKSRYNTWSPYMSVFPISADPTTNEVTGTNKKTYGLNLAFTIECDVTAILLSNLEQIAKICVEKGVIRHLSEIIHSTEIGKIPDRIRAMADLELRGQFTQTGFPVKGTGLLDKYQDTLRQTSFELSGLGDDCLKCDKNEGIIRWT